MDSLGGGIKRGSARASVTATYTSTVGEEMVALLRMLHSLDTWNQHINSYINARIPHIITVLDPKSPVSGYISLFLSLYLSDPVTLSLFICSLSCCLSLSVLLYLSLSFSFWLCPSFLRHIKIGASVWLEFCSFEALRAHRSDFSSDSYNEHFHRILPY